MICTLTKSARAETVAASISFQIKIAPKDSSRVFIREWLPGKRIEDYLVSATIEAVKLTRNRTARR